MLDEKDFKKFDSLVDEYSLKYVELLKAIAKQEQLSFEQILSKLPSSEIVKRDEEFIDKVPVTRVLLGMADPATYVLTYYHIVSKVPDDYPEQPRYYISLSEGSYDAPFTKQEFLNSIKQEQVKKLEKK